MKAKRKPRSNRVASDDGLGSCKWEDASSEDGAWSTSCENMFVFIVDGPVENGMKFCPYCGKHLVVEPNAVLSGAATEVKPKRDV